jgi:hypothetical protein
VGVAIVGKGRVSGASLVFSTYLRARYALWSEKKAAQNQTAQAQEASSPEPA